MTAAEAILSVLGPVALFLSTIATVAVRRHFKFVDKLEQRLGDYLDKSATAQASVAEEMRLSRLAREAQDRELAELIGALEEQLGRKIEDKRLSELRAALEELRVKRAKSDPPAAADAEADMAGEEPTIARTVSQIERAPRAAAPPPSQTRRPVAAPVGPRGVLPSRPGR